DDGGHRLPGRLPARAADRPEQPRAALLPGRPAPRERDRVRGDPAGDAVPQRDPPRRPARAVAPHDAPGDAAPGRQGHDRAPARGGDAGRAAEGPPPVAAHEPLRRPRRHRQGTVDAGAGLRARRCGRGGRGSARGRRGDRAGEDRAAPLRPGAPHRQAHQPPPARRRPVRGGGARRARALRAAPCPRRPAPLRHPDRRRPFRDAGGGGAAQRGPRGRPADGAAGQLRRPRVGRRVRHAPLRGQPLRVRDQPPHL
ncbi:MAG: Transcriptional regulator, GntR family, partial [uncultured Nocardioidaceae bacterium]